MCNHFVFSCDSDVIGNLQLMRELGVDVKLMQVVRDVNISDASLAAASNVLRVMISGSGCARCLQR